jgi:membrane-bound serine protease (ClpP class)
MGKKEQSAVSFWARGSMMKMVWIYFLMAAIVPAICTALDQSPTNPQTPTTVESPGGLAVLVEIQGPIGPATMDFIIDSLEEAGLRNAELLIIRLDTPGGLDTSTRGIVKAILNSAVPVATFVAPQGARAASAGTFILYASHIAAMSPATNVGAATPVSIIGGMTPGSKTNDAADEEDSEPASNTGDAMSHKIINDAVAYIRGLASQHGRNAEWAELAVREAASITAEKALETGVIDLIAENVGDLLEQVNGKTVKVQGRDTVMRTSAMRIEQLEPDWKSEFLGVITSPTIAYLLLLIGIYGLVFEGYNPGAVLPGVVGAICLLFALYAFQMLPVNYAGLALIALGIILMIAEVFVPSFGALGIGGIISMVIGSIILIDTDVPGFKVSSALIGAIALVSSLGLMSIIGVALKARLRPVVSGREQLVGAAGITLEDINLRGNVFVHGERWNAISRSPLRKGQDIVVTGIDGLTLQVDPAGDRVFDS